MRVTRASTTEETVGRIGVDVVVVEGVLLSGARVTVRVGFGDVGKTLTAPAIVDTMLLPYWCVPEPRR
jgi:hypothetical protein